jgi:hypothetical protein
VGVGVVVGVGVGTGVDVGVGVGVTVEVGVAVGVADGSGTGAEPDCQLEYWYVYSGGFVGVAMVVGTGVAVTVGEVIMGPEAGIDGPVVASANGSAVGVGPGFKGDEPYTMPYATTPMQISTTTAGMLVISLLIFMDPCVTFSG